MGSKLPVPAPQPRTSRAMLCSSQSAVNLNGQLALDQVYGSSSKPQKSKASSSSVKSQKQKDIDQERQQLKEQISQVLASCSQPVVFTTRHPNPQNQQSTALKVIHDSERNLPRHATMFSYTQDRSKRREPLLFAHVGVGNDGPVFEAQTLRKVRETSAVTQHPDHPCNIGDVSFQHQYKPRGIFNRQSTNQMDLSVSVLTLDQMKNIADGTVKGMYPPEFCCDQSNTATMRNVRRSDNRFMLSEWRQNGKFKMSGQEDKSRTVVKKFVSEPSAPPAVKEVSDVKYSQTVLFRPASQIDVTKQEKRQEEAVRHITSQSDKRHQFRQFMQDVLSKRQNDVVTKAIDETARCVSMRPAFSTQNRIAESGTCALQTSDPGQKISNAIITKGWKYDLTV